MNYQNLLFTIEGAVAIIKLNRPPVLNSFNREMAMELQNGLDKCATDKNIRAVILTGEGKGFCAGQDLAEAVSNKDLSIGTIVREHYNPIVLKIRELEKPVICAVNGVAAGAGANIAFACDITLAANTVNFIQSFSKIGLIPDSGGTFFLPKIIGLQKATALMMLGEKLSADQAEQIGLIYKVVPAEELQDTALKLAQQLASLPTRGLGLTKIALNKGLNNNLKDQLDVEEELQSKAGKTFDFNEGINAFLEKRAPQFKGE